MQSVIGTVLPQALEWLAAVAGGWAALLAALRWHEPRLLFGRQTALRPAPAGPHEAHFTMETPLPGHDGAPLSGVLTRPLRDALGSCGTHAHTLLVWFGGRNENVHWTPAIASWLGPGYAVAAWSYRSRPAQPEVVADALHALRWLREESRFPDTRLVIAGRSLGSAVAMQVAAGGAAGWPLAGLVLLSPMDSVRSMVAAHPLLAPAAWCLGSPFDSLSAASAIRCPTLVLLAEHDDRVPHWRSRRLVQALAGVPVEVQVVPGTVHRSLPRSARALRSLAAFAERCTS